MKKISEFLSENFYFLVVKFSVYLNRLVFEMVVGTHWKSLNKAIPMTTHNVNI